MTRFWWRWFPVLALVFAARGWGTAEPAANCGATSVFALATAMGRPPAAEARQTVLSAFPAERMSMADVKEAAALVGIELEGVSGEFDDVVDRVRGPKILHLSQPDHFLVALRASEEWVQVADVGGVRALPRSEIEALYSGRALIIGQGSAEPGGPRLLLPEFHHEAGITGIGQQISRVFALTNAGDEDLVVRVATPDG